MIFVTVGTHEQQFNRLIKAVDDLKSSGAIKDDVFIQTGFSTYVPNSCDYSPLLSYKEMDKYIENADIVITHGGPASFLNVLAKRKPLIIVPRKYKFDEHVNDHQLEFVEKLNQRGFGLNYVDEVDELNEIINSISKSDVFLSNNDSFNKKFDNLVKFLVRGEKY